jgi:hypothetical protein
MGIDYDAKLVCGWRVSTEMVTDQCEDIDNLREGIEEGSAKLAYASPFFDAPNHYLHWFVTNRGISDQALARNLTRNNPPSTRVCTEVQFNSFE